MQTWCTSKQKCCNTRMPKTTTRQDKTTTTRHANAWGFCARQQGILILCPVMLIRNMAPRRSSKRKALTNNEGVLASKKKKAPTNNDVSLAVGDHIRRLFVSHELGPGMPSQYIKGKIIGSQPYGNRGKKTIWWTLLFDHPAPRTLSCVTEEVVLMKLSHRDWTATLTQFDTSHIGNKLVVRWTAEDSDLSMTDWTPDLRVCVVSKYLPILRQVVLEFKCGYEKFVTVEAFYTLREECLRFHHCLADVVINSVQVAMEE